MQDNLDSKIQSETPYPFDNPSLTAVVRKYAVEYEDKIRTATRPKTLSENPSDLQKWEAAQILRRKQKDTLQEDDFGWLLRTLYEETFLVNANPDLPPESIPHFEGSQGLTVGGLISHYFSRIKMDGVDVKDVAKYELRGETLTEALINEPDFRKRESIIYFAQEMSSAGSHRMFDGHQIYRVAKDPKKYPLPAFMTTYGYRLLRMLKNVPELLQPIQDPQLKKIIGYRKTSEITTAEFVQVFWNKIGTIPGSPVLTDWGGFKYEDEEGVTNGLRKLLFVRAHPELQVIYHYLSPSGFLDKFTNQ